MNPEQLAAMELEIKRVLAVDSGFTTVARELSQSVARHAQTLAAEVSRLTAIADELRRLVCQLCSDGSEVDEQGYHLCEDEDGDEYLEKCEAWTWTETDAAERKENRP